MSVHGMSVEEGHNQNMRQAITGFYQDAAGDWIAMLACGHTQHVRNRPPWQLRPWVTTPEGRAGSTGETLECVRCEQAPDAR